MSLISVAELAAALDDPDLRIADVRWSLAAPSSGRVAYVAAHLPGAVFIDLDSVLTAPSGPGRHPLPDPAAFAAALGALGIGRSHRVVAYDDAGATAAARLWWMLDVLGHTRAAVLDGGIGAWRAAGLPETATVPAFPSVESIDTPTAATAWPQTIERVALTEQLGRVTLLDARAPERYRGQIEPIDRVPGHIPSARSLPTAALLGADGRFLAPPALASRFAEAGIRGSGGESAVDATPARAGVEAEAGAGAVPDTVAVAAPEVEADTVAAAAPEVEAEPDTERVAGSDTALDGGTLVVVSCGSGVNACHLALAMRVAGLPDPLLYPGSYSDWTQSGMPVATGDVPGDAPRAGARTARSDGRIG